ncbi:MAG: 2-oxoacid:ferredoxin oxidoreductase subunit beta [Candidatus Omnitrophica bacterium]|nr:2-oxoacid:ferredoxin oxidoreductase subunit beta [Candidatus Omnitrophota bacterium]
MNQISLGTYAQNTWCLGCGNFAILNAIKAALNELHAEGLALENIVLVSGIGCHAKIVDYLNLNSFYSIHGRATPVAEGIKLAGKDIKVIGFAGDGDAYGEGIEHLIFAAKRNIDITMIIHNNRVYGLTTGQYTPTSPLGFKGRSTPGGTRELPFNPLELMLAGGATFLARGFSRNLDVLKDIFKKAILHKGFSLVDVLQVCFTYFNMYEYYEKRAYILNNHNAQDYYQALAKIKEWDYNSDAPIALGVLYEGQRRTFDEDLADKKIKPIDRDKKIHALLDVST